MFSTANGHHDRRDRRDRLHSADNCARALLVPSRSFADPLSLSLSLFLSREWRKTSATREGKDEGMRWTVGARKSGWRAASAARERRGNRENCQKCRACSPHTPEDYSGYKRRRESAVPRYTRSLCRFLRIAGVHSEADRMYLPMLLPAPSPLSLSLSLSLSLCLTVSVFFSCVPFAHICFTSARRRRIFTAHSAVVDLSLQS